MNQLPLDFYLTCMIRAPGVLEVRYQIRQTVAKPSLSMTHHLSREKVHERYWATQLYSSHVGSPPGYAKRELGGGTGSFDGRSNIWWALTFCPLFTCVSLWDREINYETVHLCCDSVRNIRIGHEGSGINAVGTVSQVLRWRFHRGISWRSLLL